MERGADPGDPRVQELARRWGELVQRSPAEIRESRAGSASSIASRDRRSSGSSGTPYRRRRCSRSSAGLLTKLFPRNEGALDRTLRVLVGLAAISLVFVGPRTPLGWIGLVPLATGLLGSCPLYTLFGWNTCPLKSH